MIGFLTDTVALLGTLGAAVLISFAGIWRLGKAKDGRIGVPLVLIAAGIIVFGVTTFLAYPGLQAAREKELIQAASGQSEVVHRKYKTTIANLAKLARELHPTRDDERLEEKDRTDAELDDLDKQTEFISRKLSILSELAIDRDSLR